MLAAILAISVFLGGSRAAVFNTDARYGNWLRYSTEPWTRIPVYIEQTRYASDTTGTLANIRTSYQALNNDLRGCIEFYEVTTPAYLGRDFIWVSPAFQNGSNSLTCASFPGRYMAQNQNGQKLNIIPGTAAGQCGSNIRQIMAKFANTLGLRNEYQRPDRPITVDITKLDPSLSQFASMYAAYSLGSNYIYPTGFDYNSISMIPATTNAVSGQSMYTVPTGVVPPTPQNRLSQIDCSGIAQRYQCAIFCQDPYAG